MAFFSLAHLANLFRSFERKHSVAPKEKDLPSLVKKAPSLWFLVEQTSITKCPVGFCLSHTWKTNHSYGLFGQLNLRQPFRVCLHKSVRSLLLGICLNTCEHPFSFVGFLFNQTCQPPNGALKRRERQGFQFNSSMAWQVIRHCSKGGYLAVFCEAFLR